MRGVKFNGAGAAFIPEVAERLHDPQDTCDVRCFVERQKSARMAHAHMRSLSARANAAVHSRSPGPPRFAPCTRGSICDFLHAHSGLDDDDVISVTNLKRLVSRGAVDQAHDVALGESHGDGAWVVHLDRSHDV